MTQPYPLYDNIKLDPIPSTETRFDTKRIASALEPVIYELAVRHPTWLFEEHALRSGGENKTVLVVSFEVKDSKTLNRLGRIEISRNYGSRHTVPWVFEITNNRISNSRERGYSISTGDPKKAIKTVEKYFGPPTINEQLANVRSLASNISSSQLHTLRIQQESIQGKISPSVKAYVDAHWNAVLASMREDIRTVAEGLPAVNAEFESALAMHSELSAGKHLTVLILGDTYITYDGKDITSYTTETLPEAIKTSVGLLKLVDDSTVVTDVGIRINSNSFVLPRAVLKS